MPKLSDFDKQKAAAQRRAEKQRKKQNSPEYKAKQLQKQREAAERQQQRQREKQQAQLADPEYRQAQRDKARAKQQEQIAKAQAKPRKTIAQKAIQPKPAKPIDLEAQREKQLAAAQRQQQRQREKQLAQLQDPEYQAQQRKKVLAKPAAKSKGLKGRARTAEEKRLEALLARIGCICCKNMGWYTEAMNNQEGQHFISMHHVDGRTKPWCHAKQLPLCQYHHDTPPPAHAPEGLFPLHGTGRKLWEKVNGTQTQLLQQVYDLIDEPQPWLQAEAIDEELV